MNTKPTACPKCTGNMEEGFIMDHARSQVMVSTWVEGRPEYSFWFGVQRSGKRKLRVSTWRCKSRGYLESYTA